MKKHICNDCYGITVMRAMQNKNCKICKKEFLASSIPGEIICQECKNIYPNLCIMCGKEIQ